MTPVLKLFSIGVCLVTALTACTSIPSGITPVQHFDLNKYLGTWYEIARLDHSFERGLSQVTAEYSLRADGGIKVVNRGFSEQKDRWQVSEGKAFFVDKPNEGFLKVSFFGPFYGSYIIFELDKDYQYAFVTGPDKDYVWLLARTPTVSTALRTQFLRTITEKGYDPTELIFPKQGE